MALPRLLPGGPPPAPGPASPAASCFTQGVIDTVYAGLGALAGQGDGKVYHRYQVGGKEELAWSLGCQWAAHRMMEGAMRREELRGGTGEPGPVAAAAAR